MVLNRHVPAFALLSEKGGWGDVHKMIFFLGHSVKLKNILFEHRTGGVEREAVVS
ncbi:hypothetical protein ACR6HW_05405 [Fusibacter sp. JL298sf-3]